MTYTEKAKFAERAPAKFVNTNHPLPSYHYQVHPKAWRSPMCPARLDVTSKPIAGVQVAVSLSIFNALLCQADKDLAQIARVLGEDASPLEGRAQKTARAINEKLWDEQHGIYLDFDLASGRLLEVYVTPNFVPLYAGIPDEERARRMVESLQNSGLGLSDESLTPVPSYDRYGFAFLPTQYWRGPVWVNINWFLMRGLERYGYEEQAERLRETIISLCRDQGFYEYYDPTTGFGHGSDLFSWTAALFLDVVFED